MPEHRAQMPVIAPFTGEIIEYVPAALEEDVEEALARARRAQRLWAQMAPASRKAILLRFHVGMPLKKYWMWPLMRDIMHSE